MTPEQAHNRDKLQAWAQTNTPQMASVFSERDYRGLLLETGRFNMENAKRRLLKAEQTF